MNIDRKDIWIFTVLTLAFTAALAISAFAVSAEMLEVTDDFGRNVTLPGYSERIISLSPTNTEILFAIGAGDRVIGATEFCNYPAEAKNITRVGGVSTVNIEKVVASEADLVLGCALNSKETVERLTELNVAVVSLNPVNIQEIKDDIMLVGRLTGKEENATALVADMTQRLEAIKARTVDVKRPKVAHITWHDPLWVAGGGTVQDELIELAGGDNVFSDKKEWDTASLEEFIDRNPDVIIISVGHGVAGMQPYDYILQEERLKIVNAVKNGRVYTIDADIASRAGPRIVNATEIVYECLSESFGDTGTPTPEPAGFEAVLAVASLLAVLCFSRIKTRKNKN